MNKELLDFSRKFIRDRYMGAVACVSEGSPRIFTCWFCVANGNICWKSRTASTHSKAFAINPEASMSVYDHAAEYPDNKTGVQIIGKVHKVTDEAEMKNIVDSLAARFGDRVYKKNNLAELCAPDTNSTFYAFKPELYKLVAKQFDVHMDEYGEFSLSE